MGPAMVDRAAEARAGDLLIDIAAQRGSAGHPYVSSEALLRGPHAGRNLADAVHFLCIVHGRHPHATDHAATQVAERQALEWLDRAIDVFAGERVFLARLVAAAGPVPGTPGSADSDMVVMSQCHAIEMLARSERKGCAIGAALALALDWGAVREVLETAARRFGVEFDPFALDDRAEIRALADAVATTPGMQRAMLFGAEQISLQHHGLWDLLEARQESRKAI